MEHTSNYNLSQWAGEDRILREDFNADNAKIEAALHNMAQSTALAGNCHITIGSYVGTGTYGEENPCTLTFDFEPQIIFLDVTTQVTISGMSGKVPGYSILFRGAEESSNAEGGTLHTSWNGNSVSWYSSTKTASPVASQYNTSEQTYYYIALG